MLLMVDKGIRGRIRYSIYWLEKPINKHMKDYDKNKESSYLQYSEVQKLPVNKFGWIKDISHFNEDFKQNNDEESDGGCFLEVHVQYLEKLHNFHNDLPFLSERMKIEKVEELVANLHDKIEYVIYIVDLKQA